jgi:hypothetical protein
MQDYMERKAKTEVSVRCEHRAWAMASLGKGRDSRQAGRAFDASEESADEDGVEADMYEFSEHFRVAHDN